MRLTNAQIGIGRKVGIFRNAGQDFLTHLEEHIKGEKPAISSIPDAAVQVSDLLNHFLTFNQPKEDYKTFYCNSHLEAVRGAIEMARCFQHGCRNYDHAGRVLFYDKRQYFTEHFDPLKSGEENAFIPGVTFTADFLDLTNHLLEEIKTGILVLSLDPDEQYKDYILKLKSYAANMGMVTVLDVSAWEMQEIADANNFIASGFDIVVWGEALTGFQAPFGALSTRRSIYTCCNLTKSCLFYSIIHGGNRLLLSFVKKNLFQAFPALENISRVMSKGFFNKVRKALGKQKPALDFTNVNAGGPGEFVFSWEIFKEVIRSYCPETNYHGLLVNKLALLTGMPHVFTGVGKYSARESGMLLACLANPGKNKIVVLENDHDGKKRLARKGRNMDRAIPGSICQHVITCNPYAASAPADLLKIFAAGGVGLVWLGHSRINGQNGIPADILSLVDMNKEIYGYLVGADEKEHDEANPGNLTGIHPAKLIADFVTFSKSLNSAIFPISATAVTENVYSRALRQNPGFVRKLETLYQNQFGAHVALHALPKANFDTRMEPSTIERYKALARH